jgi:hypothetical protein
MTHLPPAKYPQRYVHRLYGHAWAQFSIEGQQYLAEWDEHGKLTVTNEQHLIMPADHPIVLEANKFYEKMNTALERPPRPR